MRAASAFAAFLLLSAAHGGELKPETLSSWDDYIRTVDAHTQERLQRDHSFLWVDELAERGRDVRAGKIVVSPAGVHTPQRVPSGLIHHWVGAAYFPGVKVNDIFPVVRDYGKYKNIYHPYVIDSKAIRQDGSLDQYSLTLMNKAVVVKVALDSDCETSYIQVDARRWYSVTRSTRVQEIQNFGQPSERKLPADQGSGYIWRLYSISRFEERDGGVYFEVEAIVLSRDIPVALRMIVDPIVRRVSKSSVETSLKQTQEAVALSSDVASATSQGHAFRQQ